jgi:hypothetical protein
MQFNYGHRKGAPQHTQTIHMFPASGMQSSTYQPYIAQALTSRLLQCTNEEKDKAFSGTAIEATESSLTQNLQRQAE